MHLSKRLAITIAAFGVMHPSLAGSRTEVMDRCRQVANESKGTKEDYAYRMRTCTTIARDHHEKFATDDHEPPTVSIERESDEASRDVLRE
jgi:hypothetical protein